MHLYCTTSSSRSEGIPLLRLRNVSTISAPPSVAAKIAVAAAAAMQAASSAKPAFPLLLVWSRELSSAVGRTIECIPQAYTWDTLSCELMLDGVISGYFAARQWHAFLTGCS